MTAADRWRRDLVEWAIPDELLQAAESSPYSWPAGVFRRRAVAESPTTGLVQELLAPSGTLLDVGAGTGRAALPLARAGYPVTAVERDGGMAAALREEASGLPVTVVEASWPEAVTEVSAHDVALAAHVVYDVQDIAPFLKAMSRRARRAVVLELTAAHPWSHLSRYYQRLHGLDRPRRPTVVQLVEVIEEQFGIHPRVVEWERPPSLVFRDRRELLEVYGRRLVVPASRRAELADLLAPEIRSRDGGVGLGDEPVRLAMVWWPPS